MAEIFVSYRRSDAAGAAGRLTDRLKQEFGSEKVFHDLDSISAGADFEESIRDAVRRAAVVLVVIGPRWLDARDAHGRRRLEDPKDYVRLEAEAALALGVQVIPLLVEGAPMPKPSELPESLAGLSVLNAHELSDRRWRYDADQLIELLADRFGFPRIATPAARGLRGAAAAAVGYLPDLVRLLRRPKRFILSRNGGRDTDLVSAFTFWALSIALGHVFILLGWPRKSPVAELVLIGLSAGILATLALSLPLWLAWWLLGIRRHYTRVLVPLAYQSSVCFLGFAVCAMLLLFAFEWHEAGQLEKARDALFAVVGMDERFRVTQTIVARLVDAPEVLRVLPLYSALQLAVAIWLFLAWGAYRQSLGASRLRSLAAWVLFVALGWLLLLAVAWLTPAPRESRQVASSRAEVRHDCIACVYSWLRYRTVANYTPRRLPTEWFSSESGDEWRLRETLRL